MVAPVRCSVPSFMHASRMARISACAVGSWLWATLLALSARTSPSLTITAANGRPPSMTFCRARSMVRCAKSITGPPSEGRANNSLIYINVYFERGALVSVRSESDSLDLATSVGATATMVAANRALASQAGLIDDPFAAPLVRAVGIDVYTRLVNGEIPVTDGTDFDPARMARGMAVRTRFYDRFFVDATRSGIRQAVILAAGLDARGYRLPWPQGTVLYEVDLPEVIEFKTSTLAKLGAEPTGERRTVAVDLRDDWPAALQAAGFDPQAPSVWSAEGLVVYLPPEAQDALFGNITELSAPQSQLACEFV